MTINPELLPHASYGELLDGGAEELKQKIESLDFMPVMFKPQTVFALVSVMQLALRHPAMGILESPHEAAERFIDAAREYQHVAVLGKTGSGKTSTAKLRDRAGRGGPARASASSTRSSRTGGASPRAPTASGRACPSTSSAGRTATCRCTRRRARRSASSWRAAPCRSPYSTWPTSRPGGLQHFFVDFASVLIRKMRGVLYLVIEEAHEFAPKERTGVGQENLAIHWAKKLATAGRSKGIRLILLSQRTQALHNALLGSCDTLIAHRFTAPADQAPVVQWLKANVEPEIAKRVAASLSSLKTGEGWICSGEAKIFEQRQFPRIHTYDNTATPTGDSHEHAVKTAPVDAEKLRQILGDAVKEAEENDREERDQARAGAGRREAGPDGLAVE
jgi:hypothetical protein